MCFILSFMHMNNKVEILNKFYKFKEINIKIEYLTQKSSKWK